MARVRLIDVVKRFGDVVAVDHINLDIRDGEFFALLGPSGSGKTTTLRLIAGLEVPDEGEIYIDDKLVNHVHPKDRDIAMVFQNYALYPHMKVYDNIAFPLIARKKELGLTKDVIRKKVIEIAKLLGIENLLNRYPSQLSGGQQQRVALARALVRRPKVWLLDEPLSNLDAKLRLAMRVELKKLQKKLGITAIYVTHDQVEAMSMADRIAVMDSGKVQQIGNPHELYYKPANTFVATFIGSPPMNLITCHLVEGEHREFDHGFGIEGKVKTGYYLECPGFKAPIAPDIVDVIRKSSRSNKLLLGFRPDYVRVYRSPVPGRTDIIETVIEVVEPLGSENILTVKLDGVLVKIKAPPETEFSMGEKIYGLIDWRKAILFDSVTRKLVV